MERVPELGDYFSEIKLGFTKLSFPCLILHKTNSFYLFAI